MGNCTRANSCNMGVRRIFLGGGGKKRISMALADGMTAEPIQDEMEMFRKIKAKYSDTAHNLRCLKKMRHPKENHLTVLEETQKEATALLELLTYLDPTSSQDEEPAETAQLTAGIESLEIQTDPLPSGSEVGATCDVSPESASPYGEKKFQKFLIGRIRGKRLEDVPGVGEDVANEMRKQGITTVDMLFAKYLSLDRDEHKFIDFFRTCGRHKGGGKQCFKALDALYGQRQL